MPSKVLLIRHPESAWNKRGIYQGQIDTPLSPLGRVQAELVAARLAREPISGVVTSPLRRAKVLAQAIARYHHLHAEPDERLTEISHGNWEGISRRDIEELLARSEGTWVVATHDTICRLAVAAANEEPVVGFSDVGLENAGITTLIGPHLVGSVHQVNDVEHLGEHRVDLEAQAL